MRNHHDVTCAVSRSTCFYISHKRHDFRIKLWSINRVLDFRMKLWSINRVLDFRIKLWSINRVLDFRIKLWSINRVLDFLIKLWSINRVLDFRYSFCPKHFSLWGELSDIWSKTCIGLHVNYTLFFSDFNNPRNFSTYCQKLLKHQISWISVHWEPSCSTRTDRRTGGQTWQS
jgi:hypothetical protein